MEKKESRRHPVLQTKNLQKHFQNPKYVSILKGIDLDVYKGETVAIMGRSGEGKSTLLQVLGTLEPPTSGSLTIDGQPVTAFNKSYIRNTKLAFIFQSFHLLDDYTALENVLMPARIARRPTHVDSPLYVHAQGLLAEVGLSDRMHFNTKLLSGGEKQRVAIARALCNDPDIILADEPSGNLDKQTSKYIHDLLLNFTQKKGKTLITVTHDAELANLCSRHYRLVDGLLLEENSCKDKDPSPISITNDP